MRLECRHCHGRVSVSELRRPRSGAYRECPLCNGTVCYVQPHAVFRRSTALLLSIIVLMIAGVRNPVTLVIGSVLLWVPMSFAFNMYCVYVMPLGLKPWKPRGKNPFDSVVPRIFGPKTK